MRPRLVEQAGNAPGQCLVSQDIEGPFIDAGCWAPWADPYVYLSAKWVEETARDVLNMVPRREVEEKIKTMEDQLAGYAARVEGLERFAKAHEALEDAGAALTDGGGI